MMDKDEITRFIQASRTGSGKLIDQLMPLVYDEMKRMAHIRLKGERAGHTLNTSALVHEAYLQLVNFDEINWKNKDQFYGIASQIMRNILVDYAVKRKAQKRGGDRKRVTLRDSDVITEVNLADVLTINQALKKLARVDERQVRVVECRYFGGMTIKETACALGISEPTVSRDWKMARAWLNRELSESEPKSRGNDE